MKKFSCLLFGALLATTGSAFAQTFPSKPIRIIVPYPPGGFNDTLGRTIAQKFTDGGFGAVVVDNRPGGNTVIGTDLAVKSPPDGHTLLIVSLAFTVTRSEMAKWAKVAKASGARID